MSVPLTVMPAPKVQFFDNNGDPLNGGLVYFYASGTETPQDTYSNATGALNTNPVQLDSAGRAVVFWSATSYKVRLKTSAGVTLWTVDGVPSTGLNQSIVGIGGVAWNFGGAFNVPITQTSYSSGTGEDALHAGTSILSINSALLVGTFGISCSVQSLSSITTTVAIVNLSDGSPNTPIQTVTGTNANGSTVTSAAIPFAASGVSKDYGIKVKVSSGIGFAYGIQLVRLT